MMQARNNDDRHGVQRTADDARPDAPAGPPDGATLVYEDARLRARPARPARPADTAAETQAPAGTYAVAAVGRDLSPRNESCRS